MTSSYVVELSLGDLPKVRSTCARHLVVKQGRGLIFFYDTILFIKYSNFTFTKSLSNNMFMKTLK